eukprot:CAMPEP_0170513488 /NCGR_PEP_ID=MMETSP0208-20121228/67427_1 /TAXON_ID=197538 /ORGANISM="Strombidium inclinatum, Strain S3" /LENGTH=53 /DNA_ID=CAMNT_0010797219 /DNA_START=808 /DNA_END=966 /DNA_ORIENTATION=+
MTLENQKVNRLSQKQHEVRHLDNYLPDIQQKSSPFQQEFLKNPNMAVIPNTMQ